MRQGDKEDKGEKGGQGRQGRQGRKFNHAIPQNKVETLLQHYGFSLGHSA